MLPNQRDALQYLLALDKLENQVNLLGGKITIEEKYTKMTEDFNQELYFNFIYSL